MAARFGREQPAAPDQPVIRMGKAFEPSRVVVRASTSLRLAFRREAATGRRDAVIFPELGRYVSLPLGRDVEVWLGYLSAGEYRFTCPDGELQGSIVVEGDRSGGSGAEDYRPSRGERSTRGSGDGGSGVAVPPRFNQAPEEPIGAPRFELGTSPTRTVRATRLRHAPGSGSS
jgi:hypothetical protein